MPMPGGWEYPTEVQACNLPQEVATAFSQAINGLIGVQYTPVLYIGKQIVHGTNYCIVCHARPVVPAPHGFKAVYINVSPDGHAYIIKIDNIVS